MLVRLCVLLACFFCCSLSYAEESKKPVEIPLDQIWALDMPGTKDIRTLENQEKFKGMLMADIIKSSLVENTKSMLSSRHLPRAGESAGPGFVVLGKGLEALKEANAILNKKKDQEKTFPVNQELSLVFFSYNFPRVIEFDEISRTDDEITIKYHFHDHGVMLNKTYFALIPLGVLPAGEFSVRLKRLSDTSRENVISNPVALETARRVVPDSFDFQVEK